MFSLSLPQKLGYKLAGNAGAERQEVMERRHAKEMVRLTLRAPYARCLQPTYNEL